MSVLVLLLIVIYSSAHGLYLTYLITWYDIKL